MLVICPAECYYSPMRPSSSLRSTSECECKMYHIFMELLLLLITAFEWTKTAIYDITTEIYNHFCSLLFTCVLFS